MVSWLTDSVDSQKLTIAVVIPEPRGQLLPLNDDPPGGEPPLRLLALGECVDCYPLLIESLRNSTDGGNIFGTTDQQSRGYARVDGRGEQGTNCFVHIRILVESLQRPLGTFAALSIFGHSACFDLECLRTFG